MLNFKNAPRPWRFNGFGFQTGLSPQRGANFANPNVRTCHAFDDFGFRTALAPRTFRGIHVLKISALSYGSYVSTGASHHAFKPLRLAAKTRWPMYSSLPAAVAAAWARIARAGTAWVLRVAGFMAAPAVCVAPKLKATGAAPTGLASLN